MRQSAAIITGASGGIGQEICRTFKRDGYRIIGLDVLPEAKYCDSFICTDLNEFSRSYPYRESAIKQIKKGLGNFGLRVLINNAAVQVVKPTEKITTEDWQNTLNVNLVSPFLLSQVLLPELETAHGSIINVSSIHATLTKPEFVCYATSKTALIGLTRSLAIDLGPRVRVNAICPAAVATPMLTAGFEGKQPEFNRLSGMHPLKRIAEPEEVAALALFLASEQANFITGASFNLDGGIGGRLHDPA